MKAAEQAQGPRRKPRREPSCLGKTSFLFVQLQDKEYLVCFCGLVTRV